MPAPNTFHRLLVVTADHLRWHHLYVPDYAGFLPDDCIGPSQKGSNGTAHEFEVILDGLNQTIRTDLLLDSKTGKPRGFLRDRTAIAQFYKHHKVRAGDRLSPERLAQRQYRLSLVHSGNGHAHRPRAAEFFAGIGLVRLALERQSWDVVFANDIDENKAKMYRNNWPEDAHLVVRDIHDLRADDVPECDLATASFPCNDLSIAGKWEGLDGKHSSAFWGFIQILKKMGERWPPLEVLENVVGSL